MIGTTLSHYRIESELGRGGMGIVYKAEDTKLHRTVAIKVLPASALSSDEDRARFYREARAAASLSHPNIAVIHEIDEAVPEGDSGEEPRPFIAMEYIEGETLDAHVKKGPLKLETAVQIGREVAGALKAAHAKNIVHRDIKSSNVMLGADGRTRVLDFGLAKTAQSTMLTRMGSTLGTISYMSPEQARGEEVDGRTDIWALGVVLYEMLTGRHPFGGDYEQAVVYSILNESPEPLTAIRTGIPMQLEWIVDKALAKEARLRYQTAADLAADLEAFDPLAVGTSRRSMAAATAHMQRAPERPRMRPWKIWTGIVVGIGVVAVAALVGRITAPAPRTDPNIRTLTLDFPSLIDGIFPEVSPDGHILAFVASDSMVDASVYFYDLETGDLRRQGWVGGWLRFSPDGSRLAYFMSDRDYIRTSSGGPAEMVADASSDEGAWLDDGSYVFTMDNELWMKPFDGSDLTQITRLDSSRFETQHETPATIPGTRVVLFRVNRAGEALREIDAMDIASGRRVHLGPGSAPKYLSPGYLLFLDGTTNYRGALKVRPFDTGKLIFSGPETTLIDDISEVVYTVDRWGTLYVLQGDLNSNAPPSRLLRYPSGSAAPDTLLSGNLGAISVSRDGNRIAVVDERKRTLILLDLRTGIPEPAGIAESDVDSPKWSEDGSRIMVSRNGVVELWSARGAGFIEAMRTVGSVSFDWNSSVGLIALVENSIRSGPIALYRPEVGQSKPITSRRAYSPALSPDGALIAYLQRRGSGGQEVVVTKIESSEQLIVPFGDDALIGALWAADGSSLFLLEENGRVMNVSIDVTSGAPVQSAKPTLVRAVDRALTFDVAANGDLFVVQAVDDAPNQEEPVRFSVVVNWIDRVKKLAPLTR